MGYSTNNLTALIGSRICHDLISPIGAITNGLELMQMSGASLTPEVALITESVGNANARIRFFRVAYGLASAQQSMGRAEIIGILKAGALGARLVVHWGPLEDVPRPEVRLAFLALQCLDTAMPYGGRVTITREGQAWIITALAEKLRQTPDLWAALNGASDPVDVTPAEVQFALLPLVAQDEGRSIAAHLTDNTITMRF